MKAKIWIEYGKWFRIDQVLKNGNLGQNLYHMRFSGPMDQQAKSAKEFVIANNPNKMIDFV